jgi:phage-related protein
MADATGHIRVETIIDDSLKSGLKGVSDSIFLVSARINGLNLLTRSLTNSNYAVSQSLKSVSSAQSGVSKTARELSSNQAVLANYLKQVRTEATAASTALRSHQMTVSQTSASYKQAGAEIAFIDQKLRHLNSTQKVVDRTMRANALQTMSKQYNKQATELSYVGQRLTMGLTLPLVTLGRLGFSSLKKLDQELIRTRKLLDDTGDGANDLEGRMKVLGERLDDISYKWGVSRELLQGLAGDFAELGISDPKTLANLVQITNEIEKLGNVDITDAGKLTQSIYQNLLRIRRLQGMSVTDPMALQQITQEVRGAIALFNYAENKTSLSLKNIADAFPEVSGAATSFGLNMATTAALLVPMVSAGFRVGASANSIKVSLQKLVLPTKDTRKLISALRQELGPNFKMSADIGGKGLQNLIDGYIELEKSAYKTQGTMQLFGKAFGVRQGPRMEVAIQQMAAFQKQLNDAKSSETLVLSTLERSINAQLRKNGLEEVSLKNINGIQELNNASTERSKENNLEYTKRAKIIQGIQRQEAKQLITSEKMREAMQDISTESGKILIGGAFGQEETGRTMEAELRKSEQSLNVQAGRVRESVKSIARDFTVAFGEILKYVSPIFIKIAKTIRELSPGFKKAIGLAAIFLVTIGPIIRIFSLFKQSQSLAMLGLSKGLVLGRTQAQQLDAQLLKTSDSLLRLGKIGKVTQIGDKIFLEGKARTNKKAMQLVGLESQYDPNDTSRSSRRAGKEILKLKKQLGIVRGRKTSDMDVSGLMPGTLDALGLNPFAKTAATKVASTRQAGIDAAKAYSAQLKAAAGNAGLISVGTAPSAASIVGSVGKSPANQSISQGIGQALGKIIAILEAIKNCACNGKNVLASKPQVQPGAGSPASPNAPPAVTPSPARPAGGTGTPQPGAAVSPSGGQPTATTVVTPGGRVLTVTPPASQPPAQTSVGVATPTIGVPKGSGVNVGAETQKRLDIARNAVNNVSENVREQVAQLGNKDPVFPTGIKPYVAPPEVTKPSLEERLKEQIGRSVKRRSSLAPTSAADSIPIARIATDLSQEGVSSRDREMLGGMGINQFSKEEVLGASKYIEPAVPRYEAKQEKQEGRFNPRNFLMNAVRRSRARFGPQQPINVAEGRVALTESDRRSRLRNVLSQMTAFKKPADAKGSVGRVKEMSANSLRESRVIPRGIISTSPRPLSDQDRKDLADLERAKKESRVDPELEKKVNDRIQRDAQDLAQRREKASLNKTKVGTTLLGAKQSLVRGLRGSFSLGGRIPVLTDAQRTMRMRTQNAKAKAKAFSQLDGGFNVEAFTPGETPQPSESLASGLDLGYQTPKGGKPKSDSGIKKEGIAFSEVARKRMQIRRQLLAAGTKGVIGRYGINNPSVPARLRRVSARFGGFADFARGVNAEEFDRSQEAIVTENARRKAEAQARRDEYKAAPGVPFFNKKKQEVGKRIVTPFGPIVASTIKKPRAAALLPEFETQKQVREQAARTKRKYSRLAYPEIGGSESLLRSRKTPLVLGTAEEEKQKRATREANRESRKQMLKAARAEIPAAKAREVARKQALLPTAAVVRKSPVSLIQSDIDSVQKEMNRVKERVPTPQTPSPIIPGTMRYSREEAAEIDRIRREKDASRLNAQQRALAAKGSKPLIKPVPKPTAGGSATGGASFAGGLGTDPFGMDRTLGSARKQAKIPGVAFVDKSMGAITGSVENVYESIRRSLNIPVDVMDKVEAELAEKHTQITTVGRKATTEIGASLDGLTAGIKVALGGAEMSVENVKGAFIAKRGMFGKIFNKEKKSAASVTETTAPAAGRGAKIGAGLDRDARKILAKQVADEIRDTKVAIDNFMSYEKKTLEYLAQEFQIKGASGMKAADLAAKLKETLLGLNYRVETEVKEMTAPLNTAEVAIEAVPSTVPAAAQTVVAEVKQLDQAVKNNIQKIIAVQASAYRGVQQAQQGLSNLVTSVKRPAQVPAPTGTGVITPFGTILSPGAAQPTAQPTAPAQPKGPKKPGIFSRAGASVKSGIKSGASASVGLMNSLSMFIPPQLMFLQMLFPQLIRFAQRFAKSFSVITIVVLAAVGVFRFLKSTFGEWKDSAGPFLTNFKAAWTALAGIFTTVKIALADFFQSFFGGSEKSSGSMQDMGKKILKVSEVVRDFAIKFARFFNLTIKPALYSFLSGLKLVIQGAIKIFGGVFNVIKGIVQKFQGQGDEAGKSFDKGFEMIKSGAFKVFKGIIKGLAVLLIAIVKGLEVLGVFIVNVFEKVVILVIKIIALLAKGVINLFFMIPKGIVIIVQQMLNIWKEMQTVYIRIVSELVKIVVTIFFGLPKVVINLVKKLVDVFAFLLTGWGKILDGMSDLFVEWANKVVKFVSELPIIGRFLKALKIDDAMSWMIEKVGQGIDKIGSIYESAGGIVSKISDSVFGGISDGLEGLTDDAKNGVDTLANGLIKGVETVADFGQALYGYVQAANNGLLTLVDSATGSVIKKVTQASDIVKLISRSVVGFIEKISLGDDITRSMGDDFKGKTQKKIDDALENLDPEAAVSAGEDIANAVTEGLKTLKTNFFDKVVDNLGKALEKQKNKITDALNLQKDNQLKIFDDQIAAIDALADAEEKLTATIEFENQKREAEAERALQKKNYEKQRALAIYEGRIDDARTLDQEETKNRKDAEKNLKDLETNRNKTLQAENRDTAKGVIAAQKTKAAEAFDADIKAFEEFAAEILAKGTFTQAELEAQFAAISAKATTMSGDMRGSFETFYQAIPGIISANTENTAGMFNTDMQKLVTAAKTNFGTTNDLANPETILGATAAMLTNSQALFTSMMPNVVAEYSTGVNDLAEINRNFADPANENSPGKLFEKAISDANEALKREYIKMQTSATSAFAAIVKGINEELNKLAIDTAMDAAIEKLQGLKKAPGADAGPGSGSGSGSGSSAPAPRTDNLGGLLGSINAERNMPTMAPPAAAEPQRSPAKNKSLAEFRRQVGAKGYFEINNRGSLITSIKEALKFYGYDTGSTSDTLGQTAVSAVASFKNKYGIGGEPARVGKATAEKLGLFNAPGVPKRYYGGAIKRMMGGPVGAYGAGGTVPGFAMKAVPALLHGGEYVVNAKAVQNLGSGFLQYINNLKNGMPRFGIPTPNMPDVNINQTVNVNGGNSENINNYNFYVDNFIGEDKWFEGMMNEYNVKVIPNKQKSAGLESRVIRSYNGINKGI